MHDVVIVGGGLAGLFTASELLHAGVEDVVVVEASEAPGGVARTINRDGYSLEPAAGTLLLPHPHLTPVLERIGATTLPAVDAGIRHVFTRGRLVTLPSSPRAAFAPLVPWIDKLRALKEPFVRSSSPEGETLDAFLRRRLGDGLGGTLAWVAASGVFAGDPTRMSARAAFPAIVGLEDLGGSIVRGGIKRLRGRPKGSTRPTSHVPVGGMTGVAEAGAARLGDRLLSGRVVESAVRVGDRWEIRGSETIAARHLILATRPSAAGRILGGEIAEVLGRAIAAPVAVVGLGGERRRLPLPAGFGALTGPDAGLATLGVLFESSYAPSRAPEGASLAKVIAGGATHPEVVDWDDDRLLGTIIDDVSLIIGSEIDPEFVEIVRHHEGIPQYQTGHLAWLGELEQSMAASPGLHLTGWGYRGVGVAHLAADAVATARRITETT